MSGKKIAIIYKSLTGNTRQVAEAIRDALGGEEIVYFGEPKPDIVADLYFVGSWTDKGSCDGTVGEYLKQLEGKKLAVFGTAGYGGSREYYQKLACRVTECVPDTSEVLGSFYCRENADRSEKPLCGDAAGAPGRSEAECERKKF